DERRPRPRARIGRPGARQQAPRNRPNETAREDGGELASIDGWHGRSAGTYLNGAGAGRRRDQSRRLSQSCYKPVRIYILHDPTSAPELTGASPRPAPERGPFAFVVSCLSHARDPALSTHAVSTPDQPMMAAIRY